MTNLVDTRYEKFQELKRELQDALIEGASEADTRLKVLDRILFEVMGWKHESVTVEPSRIPSFLKTCGKSIAYAVMKFRSTN